jgi:hypothetical protein
VRLSVTVSVFFAMSISLLARETFFDRQSCPIRSSRQVC